MSAPIHHTIHSLLRERRSPRAFLPEALEPGVVDALLEAARWAPSCFNEQPWRLVVAEQGTPAFDAFVGALMAGNQGWAKHAGALIAVASCPTFAHNGKPNRWAAYDTGAAVMALSLQAVEEGLVTHQMGGFDADALAAVVALPEGFELHSVVAVGRQGPAALLPDALAEREVAPRVRRSDVGFDGSFDKPRGGDAAVEDVLSFWFGELNADGIVAPETAQRWWKVDPAFDATIRDRYGDLYERARRGELAHWARSARGRLALILVLDQFSRNMFRDTAAMYGTDDAAVELVLDGLDLGLDQSLAAAEKAFFYMPLMHSEEEEVQELCLAAFTMAAEEAEGPARDMLMNNVDYAQRHLDIVARWGRFPHRNARLGRPSTEAELAFLETPGSSF